MQWLGGDSMSDVTKETTVNEQEEGWGRAEGGEVAGPRSSERFGLLL